MKLLNFTDVGSNKFISLVFEDGTYGSISISDNTRDKDDLIKDAYILLKNMDRSPYTGDLSLLEDVTIEKPKVMTFTPDFITFKGSVYDQYGDILDVPIKYTIEGTDKARIEGNNLIEDPVEEDTHYVIKATIGDLVDKQERTIYKPVKPTLEATEIEERLAATEKAMADLMLMLGGMQ